MFDIIISVVKVYYANIANKKCEQSSINSLASIRAEYVDSIRDANRKKQSLWVWKLLEFSFKKIFGHADFDFSYNGDFFSVNNDNVNFSLSHSKNIVVVAISEKKVGVDVEICSNKILKLNGKIDVLTTEQNYNLIDKLTLAWTEKESLFKAKNCKKFHHVKINEFNDNYFITVCCDCDDVEFIKVELDD